MAEVVVFDIDAASAIQKLAQLRESTLLLKEEQKRLAEQVKEGNFFKALKRLFSILLIEKAKKPLLQKLISFFNSETGILYKANADLQILINVISNTFRQVKIEDIKNNLQIIKANLSIQTETHKNCSIIKYMFGNFFVVKRGISF
jgi:multidrug resistance efflux pump